MSRPNMMHINAPLRSKKVQRCPRVLLQRQAVVSIRVQFFSPFFFCVKDILISQDTGAMSSFCHSSLNSEHVSTGLD